MNSRLTRRPIQKWAILFIFPTFLCFCIGFIWPFLQGIYLSFCNFNTPKDAIFQGIANYQKALSDPGFANAFRNTAFFAVILCLDKYEPNEIIGNVKYNDKYLVDAIINGHTHTKQAGFIHRNNGNLLPVIQSNGGLATIGRIDFEYDLVTKIISKIKKDNPTINNEMLKELVEDKLIIKYHFYLQL